MGVDISILANHQIKGKTFAERISEFEEKLDTKVQFLPNLPFVKENEPAKTDVPEDVIFYIGSEYDFEEDYFNKVGEIHIRTNYHYFDGLRLLKKIMVNSPAVSTDFPYWLDYLGDIGLFNKAFQSEFIHSWKAFQKFQVQLVKKLGGNKVLYFDDQSFQEPENLFFEGESMEVVFPELEKVGRFFDIEMLYNDFRKIWDDDTLRKYGFYEDIK